MSPTEIERLDKIDRSRPLLQSYGGRSLHEQSHGESFLALILNRFGGNGLYILDEPEAALSPSRQLTLLAASIPWLRRIRSFLSRRIRRS
jgi:predicted ATPase